MPVVERTCILLDAGGRIGRRGTSGALVITSVGGGGNGIFIGTPGWPLHFWSPLSISDRLGKASHHRQCSHDLTVPLVSTSIPCLLFRFLAPIIVVTYPSHFHHYGSFNSLGKYY